MSRRPTAKDCDIPAPPAAKFCDIRSIYSLSTTTPKEGTDEKTTKVLVGVGVAVAIGGMALGGASLAHRNGGFGDHADHRAVAMFDAVDADRDGRLSQAEIDKAREDRHATLAAHDADGDGKLGLEEFARLWSEAKRPLTVRAFQRLDADGDAVISRSEYERPLTGIAERRDRRDHHHDRHRRRHDD